MKKFSVVLAHYNQMDYIEEAIKSVMNQDYKDIELVVADDCSPQFDYDKIEKMIKKHNKNKFDYQILTMKNNSGTVKNLKNALNKSKGEYILFFASDDTLYDNKVISKFASILDEGDKDIVTAQCLMCDDNLENGKEYVKVKEALALNKKGPAALFQKMSEYCIYSAGATAYRKEVLTKHKLFDENYKYIEDWSAWVKLSRLGEMIYYYDFNALNHRDGGISHSEYTKKTLPPHVRGYYKDMLDIYVLDVLPYIDGYKFSEQSRIIEHMEDDINYFGRFAPELYEYHNDIRKKLNSDSKLKNYMRIRKLVKALRINFYDKIKILIKFNRSVPITFICWIASCLLFNHLYVEESANKLLLWYILMYLVIYIVVYKIDKLIHFVRKYRSYRKRGN